MHTRNNIAAYNFSNIREKLTHLFKTASEKVHPARWQGIDVSNKPDAVTYELMNVDIHVPQIPENYKVDVDPNLPWADDHFEERVSGVPLNPGVEWANWPWGESAKKFLEGGGMYNHSYAERYWPKFAGKAGQLKTVSDWSPLKDPVHKGIRWEYGDLNDVVQLLVNDPLTRQAWIPIFFPEDTGVGDGGRKPCTLGYQFMVRNDRLHLYYPLRSCDFIRHFNDDIYLTIRLGEWVLDRCREKDPRWNDIKLGSYTMHCTSLHIFANDRIKL